MKHKLVSSFLPGQVITHGHHFCSCTERLNTEGDHSSDKPGNVGCKRCQRKILATENCLLLALRLGLCHMHVFSCVYWCCFVLTIIAGIQWYSMLSCIRWLWKWKMKLTALLSHYVVCRNGEGISAAVPGIHCTVWRKLLLYLLCSWTHLWSTVGKILGVCCLLADKFSCI